MIMTRLDRVMLGVVLAGGWAIGTVISLIVNASPLSVVLIAVASLGGAVTVWSEIRGASAAWSWGGAAVAAVAFTVAAVGPHGEPIWPAGACWVFVIVAGITASYADTSFDGVLELAAGVLAVLPVVPLAMHAPQLWILAFLMAGAVNAAVMFGHRHRTAERKIEETRAEVQLAERTAMARELHDVIAHEVTGIVVLAQAGIAAGSDATGTLARIERSGARALADIRAMVGTLREPNDGPLPLAPSASGSLGLRAALADLAQDVAGERITLAVDPAADGEEVPDLVRLVAHRVVIEGVTNARRHAPGGSVRVTVGREDGALRVDVADDGPADGGPAGPGPGGGTGLTGLVERAATVGGEVTYGPDGQGWLLSASLPMHGGAVT
ncbi:Signal transduction histidine kinase [Tsukamurella pulmonis]|uniref:histidine kinase n=3 Tax=Tsukamurella pulmonis TaxID=47312 RepID=A0A1H1GWC3_9ACTN|nr:histidine kinase [Tsukamurella pulmonis]SDR17383.1 Signal transduction histidine kinase [Tsukamurella pulmonis]SUP16482.1 Oxygen sensor histidine kinase nreB [Tsukamurella pulmonis]